jgi:hypothetical protein
MNTWWFKSITLFLSAMLLGLIINGAYQFYFKKPTPIVNNTTLQPGATLNVKQAEPEQSTGRLYTGVYGGRSGGGNEIGIEVGWLW